MSARRRWSRSVEARISALVLTSVAVTGLLVGLPAYLSLRNRALVGLEETLVAVAHERAAACTMFAHQQRERISLVASRTRMRELLAKYLDAEIDTATLRHSVRQILEDARLSMDGVRDLSLASPDGQILASTDPQKIGVDVRTLAVYEAVTQETVFGVPFIEHAQPLVRLAAPTYTTAGRRIGTVIATTSAQPLVTLIRDRPTPSRIEVRLAIRSENGVQHIVSTQRAPLLGAQEVDEAMEFALAGQSGFARAADHAGREVFAAYARVAETPWGLVAQLDVEDAFAPISAAGGYALALASLALAGALVGARFVARRMTRSVRQIESAAAAMARGDFPTAFDGLHASELQDVRSSFGALRESLEQNRHELEARVRERTSDLERSSAELARSREALRSAVEQSERADRAKSDFLAVMSHEIRTPLSGVIGLIELMMATEMSPAQREYAESIDKSSHALLDLVNHILDLSKIEAGHLETDSVVFRLGTMLRDSLHAHELRALNKGLEFGLHLDPTLPAAVLGDPGQLRQILNNLVGNSLKFTESGRIDVHAGVQELDGKRIRLSIVVSDTGPGIDEEHRARIFRRFDRGDPRTFRRSGGSGLGLSISRELARAMGGELQLESAPGEGSRFIATAILERADPDEISANPLLPGLAADAAGFESVDPADRCHVLVVDDDEVNRLVSSRLLEMRGHSVTTAASGAQALELCRSESFDVIVMDLHMPGMDGLETTHAIRGLEAQRAGGRRTPILAMTGAAMKGDRERCLAEGMDGYLAKPVLSRDLFSTLEALAHPGASPPHPPAGAPPRSHAVPPPPEGTAYDRERALDSLGGDEQLLADAAKLFVDESASLCAALRGAVEAQDAEAIAASAHRVKGAVGVFAAEASRSLAQELEADARRGEIGRCAADFAALQERIDELVAALRLESSR